MKDLKPIGVKAPMSLLPRAPLGAIAGVFEHGAIKYGPWNWQDKSQPQARIEELHNALLRHTLASGDPSEDDFDDESRIHHLAHAGACILILLFKLGIDYKPSDWVTHGRPEGYTTEEDEQIRTAVKKFFQVLLNTPIQESTPVARCLVTGNLSIVDPREPDLTHYVSMARLVEDGYFVPGCGPNCKCGGQP